MYVKYPLSLRNVEDLLAERGIDICHETVRLWWNRFGPMFAAEIRRKRVDRMRAHTPWRWHLDEVYVKINGELHYLWRAVDHEGEVLESFARPAIRPRHSRLAEQFSAAIAEYLLGLRIDHCDSTGSVDHRDRVRRKSSGEVLAGHAVICCASHCRRSFLSEPITYPRLKSDEIVPLDAKRPIFDTSPRLGSKFKGDFPKFSFPYLNVISSELAINNYRDDQLDERPNRLLKKG
jgi:hypothetical protein